jgi:hypothetical protein
VTIPKPCARARIGALLLCCALLPALSGCSLWNRVFHRNRALGCTETPFRLNTDSRPLLKVPEGMSAPDTRNAVRIPDLSDHPEHLRGKTEPCLAEPPNYFTTPLKLNLPKPPPEPKSWWQFWRKNPVPAPAVPSGAAPAAPATPAPTTPSPAPNDSTSK